MPETLGINTLLEQKKDSKELLIIGKEVQEAIQNKDQVDFPKIINEALGTIGQNDADALIKSIDAEKAPLNKDADKYIIEQLDQIIAILQPIASPISDKAKTAEIEQDSSDKVKAFDKNGSETNKQIVTGDIIPTINETITRISKITGYETLQNNLNQILKMIDIKTATVNNFNNINNFLKNCGIDIGEVDILNHGKQKFILPENISITEKNKDISNILIGLKHFLKTIGTQIGHIETSNSTKEKIDNNMASINKLIAGNLSLKDLHDNTDIQRVANYIKEKHNDNEDDNIKQNIINLYRKEGYNNTALNSNTIISTIESCYNEEIARTKELIDTITNNNFDYGNWDLVLTNRQGDQEISMITNYITNTKDNPNNTEINNKIKNIYRTKLKNRKTPEYTIIVKNAIEKSYKETIDSTNTSIKKLNNIKQLNDLDNLENDIDNIINYIKETKGSPDRTIMNFYNTFIKGKEPKGTGTDKNIFNRLKTAIESPDGYKNKIIEDEINTLSREINSLKDQPWTTVKAFIQTAYPEFIIEEQDFNNWKAERQKTIDTEKKDAIKKELLTLMDAGGSRDPEAVVKDKYNSQFKKDDGADVNTIIESLGDTNYKSEFADLLRNTNLTEFFNKLEPNEKTAIEDKRRNQLNSAMRSLSKHDIESFNYTQYIDKDTLYSKMNQENIKQAFKIITFENIQSSDTPAQQKQKLKKIQKLDYTLRLLQNPGDGNHGDGFKNVMEHQRIIYNYYPDEYEEDKNGKFARDGKFGNDTLTATIKRINDDNK